MQNRIRTASAILGSVVAVVTVGSPVAATSERANLACVTRGEFSALSNHVGDSRAEIESAWRVKGYGVWDRDHSDPGHDTYIYRRCGKRADDGRNTVHVTYARHSRIWTNAWLDAHGVTVEAITPINR